MKTEELQKQLAKAQATVHVLQEELAETNRGLVALTMELEQHVDERTTELRVAHDELSKTNSELMQLTLELEERVTRRTVELRQTNEVLQTQVNQRKRTEEVLRESEEKFSKAFHTSPYVITITRVEDGGFIDVNDAFTLIAGYTREDALIDSSVGLKLWANEEDRENVVAVLRAGGAVEGREYQFRTKSGKNITGLFSAQIIKLSSSPCILSSINDITERKWAEDEIRKLDAELEDRVVMRTAQLEVSNKELEAFTYSVSHDLRAPLRHISGYVELLTSRFQSALSEKARHYLISIADSTHQMGLLIDELLQFSRTGREEMRQTNSDMNKIVRETMKSVSQDYPDRSIEWSIGELPSVLCDIAMMRLVWVNLLSNAFKFTQKKVKSRVEVGAKVEANEVIFFVRDNGAGFDMQYAQKLFGIFQRLHATEEFEGTGIGLANVRRIIDRHGGRTWAEAELDKGATFYFSLPHH